MALSRCRTWLEGLVLSTPLCARAVVPVTAVDTFTEDGVETNLMKRVMRKYNERTFGICYRDCLNFLHLQVGIEAFCEIQ